MKVSARGVRIEVDRGPELGDRPLMLPVDRIGDAQRDVTPRTVMVELYRAARGPQGVRTIRLDVARMPENDVEVIGVGQPRKREGEVRIHLVRAPEQCDGGFEVLLRPPLLMPHSALVALPSIERPCGLDARAILFRLGELRLGRAGHREGQLVLKRENVAHIPIVAFGPEGRAALTVDQLAR